MNIKEQIAAKVETINTILKFLAEIPEDQISVFMMEEYLNDMKKNYKDTYDFISNKGQTLKK